MSDRDLSLSKVLIMSLVLAVPTVALAAYHDASHARVVFIATGSMGLHFEGTITEARIADDGTKITVTVPLAHLATGIDLRDEHTRTALDVAHHGTASLEVQRSALHLPTDRATNGDARGSLRIRGVAHDTAFHYTAEPHGSVIHVSGTMRIDIRDFGMEVPSYLGVRVNPIVNITCAFRVQAS